MLLAEKMLLAGFSPQFVKFVLFWLRNRVLNYKSWLVVVGNSSLAQGDPASPPLFTVYSDYDIPAKLEQVKQFKFADDTAFLVYGKTWKEVDDKCEFILKDLMNWSRINGLTLSTAKTECLPFFRKNKSPNEVIAPFERESLRYLGLVMDRNLSFTEFIDVVLNKKLTCMVFALRKIASYTLLKNRRCFLFGILSLIVWPLFYIPMLSENHLKTLETWYNKLLRACLKVGNFVDIESLRLVIGIEPFKNFYERLLCNKMISVNARNSWYIQNSLGESPNLEIINSTIEKRENHCPRENMRHERRPQDFKFKLKILQNEVKKIVDRKVDIKKLPWAVNESFWVEKDWESIRFFALEETEHLWKSRQNFIKQSIYFCQLKRTVLNRGEQNKIIESFIESRRAHWCHIPNALLDTTFEMV